jgi:hypothetical protein
MLNKLVIASGDTTVQQKNDYEEMRKSIHASTLTIIFSLEAPTIKLSIHETL